MATAMLAAGFEVPILINRDNAKAKALPHEIGLRLSQDMDDLHKADADLLIIAVGDENIREVVHQIGQVSVPVVHTSGAVSSIVLRDASQQYGSFYPLQTMTLKENLEFRNIPICVYSDDVELKDRLFEVAGLLSNDVYTINDEDRSWLHLSAVMMNNNINHLLARTQDIMRQKGLPMELLRPLLEETIAKAWVNDAATVQTGPARRNDMITHNIHMKLLESLGDDGLVALYDYFWRIIQKYYANDIFRES